MKFFSFKLVAVMAAVMMSMSAYAKKQDIGGRVLDEKGEPMPFVNVVLLSLPDSTFVQGATTDEQGRFLISTTQTDGLLKISSIGYETQYVRFADGQTIQLKEESRLLSEVIVKSTQPRTRVKGDAMRTNVEGTVLEKSGTASDMLDKIPSVEADRDGAVKVFGRGDAEVYINGRKVQDVRELTRLRADQIMYIDVVQNPGARYAASTKAVVRIQLKKAQGEGISFQDYLSTYHQYGNTIHNNFDLNYRTGGLDVTGSFWAGRFGHSESLQENDLIYYVGNDRYLGHSEQDMKNIWKGWSPQLQVNYMLNENHSFGAFYKYDRHPSEDEHGQLNTDNYENDRFTERSESHISGDDNFRKHIFNAYYNGKVGGLSIDWNLDGLFDKSENNNKTEELTMPSTTYDGTPNESWRTVENVTKSSDNFWATKLILSYPVWKGNLSLGGEYSYNHRTDAYSFLSEENLPVKATDSEINEKSSASFLEYGRAFGKLYAQVGLRYEYITNDYFNFGVKEDEVCRSYGDWFPTVVLSMPVGDLQLSLSYRQDIDRPAYANLTSQTIYINRYTYQSGNPYLKPTYTHNLVLNTAYKWMNLSVNYSRTKDNVTLATEPYPGVDDPMISLIRPINTTDDFDRLVISPSARPTFDFMLGSHKCTWNPTWSADFVLQNYKTPCSDGSILTLHRPYAQFIWNNDFELPSNWRINALMQYNTKGDFTNFRLMREQFTTRIGIQRDFSLRNLGVLTVDLRCNDIFQTNKQEVTIFGMRDLTSINPSRRTFTLDLTWKFNEARSKYRGSGAGDKQKARMGSK